MEKEKRYSLTETEMVAFWNLACEKQMTEVYMNIQPSGETNRHEIKHWAKTPKPILPLPTSEEVSYQGDIIDLIKSKVDNCSNSTRETRARKGAYVDCLIMLKESIPQPVISEEEIKIIIAREKDSFGNFDARDLIISTLKHLKSKLHGEGEGE